MTKTQAPQYRKTQQGEWVVFGPTSQVRVGAVSVAKRDGGTKLVQVARVGRPFVVDGVECCYGYTGNSNGWTAERGSNGRTYRRGDETTRCFYGHTAPRRGCDSCFDTFDF